MAKANGKRGWLVYRDSAPITGMPYWHAVLLPKEGASNLYPVIPELRHATRKVCEGGIRFRGQDFDVDHRYLVQGWWAVPISSPDAPTP
ncbi:hypothetical protein [Acidovorax sp. sif0732]|uniref:hypothetical protein n=1 Tax=Acidovorax sp. sif0732 TaxID=2854791 RepID=UPI001C439E2D|nr:hypothetical protein [Acidovorax sp. sif0732]MBV7427258.1 hypothetical protein [Acidovorax sp. sif0732]